MNIKEYVQKMLDRTCWENGWNEGSEDMSESTDKTEVKNGK